VDEMTKRAFCAGVNDYPIPGADLRGCVNDAEGWAGLLSEHYDFARSDITIITDERATKKNMLKCVKDLLAGARYGDVLVFTNSSHGSYIPDTSDDEKDRYDEVICPYDIRDNPLVDDELREVLDGIPRGVRMTVISDSCHSGNVTRVLPSEILPGLRFSDDRRPRFLSPLYWAGTSTRRRSSRRGRGATPRRRQGGALLPDALSATPIKRETHPQSSMKHVLLSGCEDTEVSYDALIGGVYHGAMTYHALKAIQKANYRITYAELVTKLNEMLETAGYSQHPQIEGRSAAKRRQIFT
jgi:hypothetical protein